MSLKSQTADERDAELARLNTLVGDLTMCLEPLREAVQRLRGGVPLATGGRRDEPHDLVFPPGSI